MRGGKAQEQKKRECGVQEGVVQTLQMCSEQ